MQTGPGEISQVRRSTVLSEDMYAGAAQLEGEGGKDLLIHAGNGTGSSFYHAVTWRNDDLRMLNAPGRGKLWSIDLNSHVISGYQRVTSMPANQMRTRIAWYTDDADNPNKPYAATVATYRWKHGSWSKVSSETDFITFKKAKSYYGIQVRPLPWA